VIRAADHLPITPARRVPFDPGTCLHRSHRLEFAFAATPDREVLEGPAHGCSRADHECAFACSTPPPCVALVQSLTAAPSLLEAWVRRVPGSVLVSR
jgi:hypothetical protein